MAKLKVFILKKFTVVMYQLELTYMYPSHILEVKALSKFMHAFVYAYM